MTFNSRERGWRRGRSSWKERWRSKELRLISEVELTALADKVNLEGEEKRGIKGSWK